MRMSELEVALRERGLMGVQVSLGLSAIRKEQWFANAAGKQAYSATLSGAVVDLLGQIELVPTEAPRRRRGEDLV